MFRVQASSLRGISCSLLILAAGDVVGSTVFAPTALAQTGIDDVHVMSRQVGPRQAALSQTGPQESSPGLTLASAPHSAGAGAGYTGAGLIRTSVDLVMVPVTIMDDFNRPVVGLNQDNFQLFEGKKAQEIKNFSSEDAPISIGILVDTSGSMKDKLERAREAVAQFCEAANPQDEFFLITFADKPTLMTDMTTSVEHVENDLLTTRSKGQTSLLDAIYMGVRKLRSARYGRRALLIISDGGDNHSRYSEHDVKAAIREADVMVYAIGTYERYVTTQEEFLGPELLQDISEETGGRSFALANVNEMPGVTRTIGTQLRHQYMLAYHPEAAHDGKWHKINVKLRLPKKLRYFCHVQARPGYYAGEAFAKADIGGEPTARKVLAGERPASAGSATAAFSHTQ